MKPETKRNLGKILEGTLGVGKVLGSLGLEGIALFGNGLVSGSAYLAPRARDLANKVAPYVLPNLAALGAMNAGIEGVDSLVNLPEWLENWSMTLGTLALGYTNAKFSGSELKRSVSDRWVRLTPNRQFMATTLATALVLGPAPMRGAITEVFQRGQDIGSQILHGDLDDDEVIAKYARYTSPVKGKDGKDIVANAENRHKYGAGRPWSGSTHKGFDVPCEIGDDLFPISAGRITEVHDYAGESYAANGRVVRYKLPDGHEVTYLHLSEFSDVEVGDIVTPNTIIGKCGISGNASADNVHVHVQIDDHVGRGGNVTDSTPYITGDKDGDFARKVRRKPHIYMPLLRNVAEMDGYSLE
jgi:murein DD-endopeptidase MepM/ murein hydrolase activator NlpD